MPKSRNRKNHKAKVAQRNQRLRTTVNKLKKEFQAKLAAEIAAEEAAANGGTPVEVMDEGDIRPATVAEIEAATPPTPPEDRKVV